MPRASLAGPFLLALLGGCASTSETAEAPAPAPERPDSAADAEEKAQELADAAHDLEIARVRLEIARLEMEAWEREQEVRVHQADLEVQLAEAALATFREATRVHRLADERLDLQTTKDRAQEAADELEQIEIMYEKQDLDDRTAEFVVSRGRRQAERAQARIAIAEGRLAALEERELPQEETRLALALDRKVAERAALEREIEIGRRKQAIALREAEHAVEKAERGLADLREGEDEVQG